MATKRPLLQESWAAAIFQDLWWPGKTPLVFIERNVKVIAASYQEGVLRIGAFLFNVINIDLINNLLNYVDSLVYAMFHTAENFGNFHRTLQFLKIVARRLAQDGTCTPLRLWFSYPNCYNNSSEFLKSFEAVLSWRYICVIYNSYSVALSTNTCGSNWFLFGKHLEEGIFNVCKIAVVSEFLLRSLTSTSTLIKRSKYNLLLQFT